MTSIQTLFADCMAIKQFADIVNPVINRTNSAYCINKLFEGDDKRRTVKFHYLNGHTSIKVLVGVDLLIRSKNTKEFRDICLTKKGKEKPNNVERWEEIYQEYPCNLTCPIRWDYDLEFSRFQEESPHFEIFPHKEPMSHQWHQEMGYSIRALLDSCKSQKAFDNEQARIKNTKFGRQHGAFRYFAINQ